MKKSKLMCLLLVLVMVLSIALTGCGGDGQENVGGNLQPNETESDDKPISLGRIDGGTYTNEYVGLGCQLDDSWTYYSAEELQEMPENVGELFEGSELGDAIKDIEQFTDMMAECADDMTTMNLLYQKLSLQERLLYATMSEEDILDATLAESDALLEAYEQAGITVQSMEKKTVTFLGEERTAIYTVAEMQGIAYYILQLYYQHLGEYAVTLTLGSFVDDTTESMLELFYAVEG